MLLPLSYLDTGERYKQIAFFVCISLGKTELAARLRWKEDGINTYGPATVAYE
ncbi:hypothetical protein DFH07DRAFT_966707 [Mycena maculata]|uniref:Uncharacterized protein n=1 Tax=Mycena maculata TaxID=230809 RepID=A0AAD7MXB9_9AGAR|nr:hypothetical protein DFH07DRAFT_966707 [Mycena maculata]